MGVARKHKGRLLWRDSRYSTGIMQLDQTEHTVVPSRVLPKDSLNVLLALSANGQRVVHAENLDAPSACKEVSLAPLRTTRGRSSCEV